jgi:NAD(P) transhydrogenase subunit alpha
VAIVPETIGRLDGFDVAVERGAGASAGYTDDAYAEAGATLVDDAFADVDAVAKVQKPSADELAKLRDGEVLVAFLQPLTDREGIEALAGRGVVAFAMESITRTTRAQSMDALTSQATVGG